jgi:adenylate cyclase
MIASGGAAFRWLAENDLHGEPDAAALSRAAGGEQCMTESASDKETERLVALRKYDILGSSAELPYDEIAELAAQVCQSPAAIINFLDDTSVWSKCRYGLPPRGPIPRELSLCTTTACGSDLVVIPDLTKDERSAHLPGVTGNPYFRFYCGMPLINPEGFSLGSLCVLDFQPREITFEQGEAVRRLARQVVTLLELRRNLLQLDRTRKELLDQREKSERLLHNMLPVAVAQELKSGNRVTARFYDAATILFADFEGFTRLAENLQPKELIGQLDDYFSAFDEIAERHRLEMLKTIGDAYMCAGGIPETNRSHPIDACLAALEMQQLIVGMNRERKKLRLPHWDLRVGLHTGPVIAGVVGRRKFIYDVWGDAVNVAARMESAGAAGKINVSEAVYHRTKDLFDFAPRGSIEAKNKGRLEMFFLLRIKASLARDGEGYMPNEAFSAAAGTRFPVSGSTADNQSPSFQPLFSSVPTR